MEKTRFQNYTFDPMKLVTVSLMVLVIVAGLAFQNVRSGIADLPYSGKSSRYANSFALPHNSQAIMRYVFGNQSIDVLLQSEPEFGDSSLTSETGNLQVSNNRKDTYGPDKGHNMLLLISVLLGLVLIPFFVFRKMR